MHKIHQHTYERAPKNMNSIIQIPPSGDFSATGHFSSVKLCSDNRDAVVPMDKSLFGTTDTSASNYPRNLHQGDFDPILAVLIDGDMFSSIFRSTYHSLRGGSGSGMFSAPLTGSPAFSPYEVPIAKRAFSVRKLLSSEVSLMVRLQGSSDRGFVGSPRWFDLFGDSDREPSPIVDDLYVAGVRRGRIAGTKVYVPISPGDGSCLSSDEVLTSFETTIDSFESESISYIGLFALLTVYPVGVSADMSSVVCSRRLMALLSSMSNGAFFAPKQSSETQTLSEHMSSRNPQAVIDGCAIIAAKLRP